MKYYSNNPEKLIGVLEEARDIYNDICTRMNCKTCPLYSYQDMCGQLDSFITDLEYLIEDECEKEENHV